MRAAPGPALTVWGPTVAAAWKGKSVAHPTPQVPPGEARPTTVNTFFAAPTDMRVQTHTHTRARAPPDPSQSSEKAGQKHWGKTRGLRHQAPLAWI